MMLVLCALWRWSHNKTLHLFMLLRCAVFKVLDKLKHQVRICLCSPIFPLLILIRCAKCFEVEAFLTQSCFAAKHLKHSYLNNGTILFIYGIPMLVLPFGALEMLLSCFTGLTWKPVQRNGTDC